MNDTSPYSLRVTLRRDLADALHLACKQAEVSVTDVVTAAVEDFTKTKSVYALLPNLKNRRLRKKEVDLLASRLKRVYEAEQAVLDNTPDNFAESDSYYTTSGIVEYIEATLEAFNDIYE
jgi:hypothetical protein